MRFEFCPHSQKILVLDIAGMVETAARKLDLVEASELRGSVCSILKRVILLS